MNKKIVVHDILYDFGQIPRQKQLLFVNNWISKLIPNVFSSHHHVYIFGHVYVYHFNSGPHKKFRQIK